LLNFVSVKDIDFSSSVGGTFPLFGLSTGSGDVTTLVASVDGTSGSTKACDFAIWYLSFGFVSAGPIF